MATKIPRERIERAARMYVTNRMACDALGIHLNTFRALCKRYGIQTPYERRKQEGFTFSRDASWRSVRTFRRSRRRRQQEQD